MGYMVDGQYHYGENVSQVLPDGAFQRAKSVIRYWITADGAPGPTGEGGFTADPGRYHLFVSWNCPWAHRTLLTRAVLGLDDQISVSYAKPNRTDDGWVFDASGEFSDPLFGVQAVHEVYARDAVPYTGRLTVPVLWDKQNDRIVNNESADIVRMLAQAFGGGPDLYPTHLIDQIEQWNAHIYTTINNGVYRAGFAESQEAYEKAAWEVFEALDGLDVHLANNRYLCGDTLTEADLRLFPTLVRFDVAYHYAFRCNLKKLESYEHLWPYTRSVYQLPGVPESVRFDIYKRGYFSANPKRNPLGIVPIGPEVPDWSAPHGR